MKKIRKMKLIDFKNFLSQENQIELKKIHLSSKDLKRNSGRKIKGTIFCLVSLRTTKDKSMKDHPKKLSLRKIPQMKNN